MSSFSRKIKTGRPISKSLLILGIIIWSNHNVVRSLYNNAKIKLTVTSCPLLGYTSLSPINCLDPIPVQLTITSYKSAIWNTFTSYIIIIILFDIRLWGFAWWNIDIVSVCSNTVCLLQLSQSWGTGSEKNLIAQLVSRLSLSEIMVQGRINIGQLVSQLSLCEKYGSGRTMGTPQVVL